MRIAKQVEEDHVIQAFLVGELRSERFGSALRGLLEQHGIAGTGGSSSAAGRGARSMRLDGSARVLFRE